MSYYQFIFNQDADTSNKGVQMIKDFAQVTFGKSLAIFCIQVGADVVFKESMEYEHI